DTMTGGRGDDTYIVDNAGDKVIEAAGEGSDIVYAVVDWSMAAGQEIESLRAYAAGAISGVSLAGNEFNNGLIGGSGNDMLNGGAGDDTLNGGTGDDMLTGGARNDSPARGTGAHMMSGRTRNDTHPVSHNTAPGPPAP